jgi:hypothetical protein
MPPQPPQDNADRRNQLAVGPDGVRPGDAIRRSPWGWPTIPRAAAKRARAQFLPPEKVGLA